MDSRVDPPASVVASWISSQRIGPLRCEMREGCDGVILRFAVSFSCPVPSGVGRVVGVAMTSAQGSAERFARGLIVPTDQSVSFFDNFPTARTDLHFHSL